MQNPDDPRTLIISSSYVSTPERREEVLLWSRVTRRLNPDLDILLVDSFSPFNPALFTRDVTIHARQENNIGHPTLSGDGWGRDLCLAIDYACAKRYDWVAFIESDMIFCRPVMPIIKKLCRIGVLAAMPISLQYHFLETGIMFFSIPYLMQTRFVERYDWPSHRPNFSCEKKIEELLSDEVMILPFRGARNDQRYLTSQNFNETFPYGCDYLTHCDDHELYRVLLWQHKLEELFPLPEPKNAY